MKATINGKTYDTEDAERLATGLTASDTRHVLHRTADGEFFLECQDYMLDGRRLLPSENIEELAPGLDRVPEMQPERERRLQVSTQLVPLTPRETLLWCIKTQIPESLRGYLLDCI